MLTFILRCLALPARDRPGRAARLATAAALAALVSASRAALEPAPLFSDHLVLQRDQPVPVWGRAEPGERVTVAFAGRTVATSAAPNGEWRVLLPPLEASAAGRTLTIRGRADERIFTDVLVGEVWLAAGQSNMDKPFGPRRGQRPTDDSDAELAAARQPQLRLYQVEHDSRPQHGRPAWRWVRCSPETLREMQFSAVAYVFGRELQRELGVPVGLIHASFGGTHIEAWIPPAAWAGRPALAGVAERRYPAWVPGVQASELYVSMIAPLAPYALRGVLWYQGETNALAADGAIYAEKMHALVGGWREAWHAPELPFYYALLAPYAYSQRDRDASRLTPETLPAFWEAQVAAQAIPHTGLIVTTDVGDAQDIHPTNKRVVGERFARLALADTYGRTGAEAHSPRFAGLRALAAGRVELRFRHAGDGLRSADGAPLTHFAIAGPDRRFHPAIAEADGDRVVVHSPAVAEPVAVRFAWHETAAPNLVNSSGLPAVPFRTDDWPVVTRRP